MSRQVTYSKQHGSSRNPNFRSGSSNHANVSNHAKVSKITLKDDDLLPPATYEEDVNNHPYFLVKVKKLISEGGAMDTATGDRKKVVVPVFDTTLVYAADPTGQATRANDLLQFQMTKDDAINNNSLKRQLLSLSKPLGITSQDLFINISKRFY